MSINFSPKDIQGLGLCAGFVILLERFEEKQVPYRVYKNTQELAEHIIPKLGTISATSFISADAFINTILILEFTNSLAEIDADALQISIKHLGWHFNFN